MGRLGSYGEDERCEGDESGYLCHRTKPFPTADSSPNLNAGTHLDSDLNPDPDPSSNIDAGTHLNPDANPRPDAGTDRNRDADPRTNGDRDADPRTNGDRDADPRTNGDRDADPRTNGDRDADPGTNGDRDADPGTNGDRDADPSPYANANTSTDGHGDIHTKTPPHTPPPDIDALSTGDISQTYWRPFDARTISCQDRRVSPPPCQYCEDTSLSLDSPIKPRPSQALLVIPVEGAG